MSYTSNWSSIGIIPIPIKQVGSESDIIEMDKKIVDDIFQATSEDPEFCNVLNEYSGSFWPLKVNAAQLTRLWWKTKSISFSGIMCECPCDAGQDDVDDFTITLTRPRYFNRYTKNNTECPDLYQFGDLYNAATTLAPNDPSTDEDDKKCLFEVGDQSGFYFSEGIKVNGDCTINYDEAGSNYIRFFHNPTTSKTTKDNLWSDYPSVIKIKNQDVYYVSTEFGFGCGCKEDPPSCVDPETGICDPECEDPANCFKPACAPSNGFTTFIQHLDNSKCEQTDDACTPYGGIEGAGSFEIEIDFGGAGKAILKMQKTKGRAQTSEASGCSDYDLEEVSSEIEEITATARD